MTVEKFDWNFKCCYCNGEVYTEVVDKTWGFTGENRVYHMECVQQYDGAEVPAIT